MLLNRAVTIYAHLKAANKPWKLNAVLIRILIAAEAEVKSYVCCPLLPQIFGSMQHQGLLIPSKHYAIPERQEDLSGQYDSVPDLKYANSGISTF